MNDSWDVIEGMDNSTSANMSGNTTEVLYYEYYDDMSLYGECKWTLPIQQTILGIELVLSLLFNGTVIMLILRKGKRNKMSFFVLHLAISDFSMAIFYILPFFITRVAGQWYAGHVPCKIYMYLNQLAMYSSTYMLVVMSVDRLYAIAKPLSATRRGLKYRRLLVLSAWFVAACVAVKDVIYSGYTVYDGRRLCETDYPPHLVKLFITLEAVINVFFPALIITICYSWIVAIVSRRSNYSTNAKHQKEEKEKVPSRRIDVVTRAKIRSTKVMFAVVSVFLVCWSPHTINFMLTVYDVVPFTCVTFIIFPFAPLNSVANPLLFLALNYKTLFEHRKTGKDLNRKSMKTTYTTITRNNTEWPRDVPLSVIVPTRDT
ncbi:cardioacceleratory peptide receptor-like isoform X2 [Ylistrum balloti]|uniref:cardioacceleratory peptide receptor-like isoform X2 n=1 Tax=Ylistrum balloti TaxID=509963 RepID=UPI0029058DF0|nr:cardioacceleratory peptide receptor-like isoform X2 [Ylistrum balloti]